MNLLDFFKFWQKNTASTAKERLHIVVSHQRNTEQDKNPDFILELKQEIIEVIKKHIKNVDNNTIQVQLQKEDDCSILELNVTLPTAV